MSRGQSANRQEYLLPIPAIDPVVFPPGLVWLIGAGPGDPSLLTLQAAQALVLADVIVHDSLVDERLLNWRRHSAEIIFAGKRGGRPSPKQIDISLRLIELSQQGCRVARLKGGDPFVFGRGGEEALTLVRAGVSVRVTPGITAGIGGLAYAGIPLTHRDVNQSVTFITGHDHTGQMPGAIDWKLLAKGSQVIVMYMALKHLDAIADSLLAGGRNPDEPTTIISGATLPEQRVLETTLGCAATDVETSQVESPTVICVGATGLLRLAIDWKSALEGNSPRHHEPLSDAARSLWGESE